MAALRVVVGLIFVGLFAVAVAPAVAAEQGGAAHEAAGHEAGGEHGHHAHIGEKGVNRDPAELRGDLAVWTFVVFLVLLGGLYLTAWKPILGALQQREEHIANNIAEAERLQREAKALLAQHEQKLAETAAQVRSMLEEARRDAEAVRQEILQQAREEADQERQRALAEIDQARKAALQELATRSADLAVQLAARILRAQVDRQAHQRLIAEAIGELAEPSQN